MRHTDARISQLLAFPAVIVHVVACEVRNAIQQLMKANGIATLVGDRLGVGGVRLLPFIQPDAAVHQRLIQAEFGTVQTMQVRDSLIRQIKRAAMSAMSCFHPERSKLPPL